MSADNDVVVVEQRGRVLLATINRPEARNAVNRAVAEGLGRALEQADTDPGIWAFVVTGAGDLSFCAGADLKAVARREPSLPADPREEAWGFAGYVRHFISKPTIAAVNGFALGGGTELALASDLVVAADSATFGLPEVKRGILAAAGGAFRLPDQLPRKVAMEMIMTGEPITAQRALELGLVNRVVPQAQVVDAALALAAAVCANAPLSVQTSKRIAYGVRDGDIPAERDSWALTQEESKALMTSADTREGLRAFAEKRAPRWQGR
jgi:crotonobetainyl-CoA hydratase